MGDINGRLARLGKALNVNKKYHWYQNGSILTDAAISMEYRYQVGPENLTDEEFIQIFGFDPVGMDNEKVKQNMIKVLRDNGHSFEDNELIELIIIVLAVIIKDKLGLPFPTTEEKPIIL